MAINANGVPVPLPNHKVHTVPSWVTALLNEPAESVAFLEVPTGINTPYSRCFLEFLGQVSVDVTDDVPGEAASVKLDGTSTTKSVEGRNRSEREYPGRLTSLRVSKVAPAPMFVNRGRFGKPPPKHSKYRAQDSNEDQLEPSMPPVLLGFGSARLKHDGKDVAAIHQRTKEGSILHLYAADPVTLRSLIAKMVRWDFERNQPDRTPRTGKYELYVLKLLDERTVIWQKQGWKKSRKMSSIILPEGQIDAILSDFKHFMSKGTKSWYSKHGLAHRRSYLFYGPPVRYHVSLIENTVHAD